MFARFSVIVVGIGAIAQVSGAAIAFDDGFCHRQPRTCGKVIEVVKAKEDDRGSGRADKSYTPPNDIGYPEDSDASGTR